MSMLMAWICPKCGLIIPRETEGICENCKTPLICTQVSAEEILSSENDQLDKWIKSMQQKYVIGYETKAGEKSSGKGDGQYIPKCPTCGSPNIRETTALEASYNPSAHHSKTAFKSFVCRNCGYAW